MASLSILAQLAIFYEFEELAKNAVIVEAEDYCHHGIAYGVAENDVWPMNEKGLAFARKEIESGFAIFTQRTISLTLTME